MLPAIIAGVIGATLSTGQASDGELRLGAVDILEERVKPGRVDERMR